jgi:hypothetical protein
MCAALCTATTCTVVLVIQHFMKYLIRVCKEDKYWYLVSAHR